MYEIWVCLLQINDSQNPLINKRNVIPNDLESEAIREG